MHMNDHAHKYINIDEHGKAPLMNSQKINKKLLDILNIDFILHEDQEQCRKLTIYQYQQWSPNSTINFHRTLNIIPLFNTSVLKFLKRNDVNTPVSKTHNETKEVNSF